MQLSNLSTVARRSLRFSPFALLAVFLWACSELGPVQSELDERQASWAGLGLTNYDYTMSLACFCPSDVARDVLIEVRAGTVASLTYVDDGSTVDPIFADNYGTVEDLFLRVQGAIDGNAFEIDAVYDEQFHYPRSIQIDFIQNAADDEISYFASSLVER